MAIVELADITVRLAAEVRRGLKPVFYRKTYNPVNVRLAAEVRRGLKRWPLFARLWLAWFASLRK